MIRPGAIRHNREELKKALLSGKYKQGFGQLYVTDPDHYCVLGVVGDLLVQSALAKWEPNPDCPHMMVLVMGSHRDVYSLPQPAKVLFGISDAEEATLSEANDRQEETFEEIALYL